MELGDIHKRPFDVSVGYGSTLSIEKVICTKGCPYEKEHAEDHLRFLFNSEPLLLQYQGISIFVPERSVAKVHPGTGISILVRESAPLYVFHFHGDEEAFVREFDRECEPYYDRMTAGGRVQWDKVFPEGKDYILPEEPNSEHIIRHEGLLIAPPHSRLHATSSPGWYFRDIRASKAVGFSSNYDYAIRQGEIPHLHLFSKEIYFSIMGATEVTVDGIPHTLSEEEVMAVEHGELHARIRIVDSPWLGNVLQIPSIDDKIVPGS